MTDARAFRGFRFPAEVILWAVRWYLQFPISYRDLERMLADREVEVDHTTMYRWVQRFAPELEKRTRRHLRPGRGPLSTRVFGLAAERRRAGRSSLAVSQRNGTVEGASLVDQIGINELRCPLPWTWQAEHRAAAADA